MESFNQIYNQAVTNLPTLLQILNVFISLFFAGAVAKDSGRLNQLGQPTILVSGITWAFATLCGGIYVAGLYWLLHHSSLTRPNSPLVSSD